MPQSLLWVQNASESSQRQQESQIRRHVQSQRGDQVPEACGEKRLEGKTKRQKRLDCVNGVPASSLRPSRSLGRLAEKSVGAWTRKRTKKATKSSTNPSLQDKTPSANRGVALSRSLPYLWHGLSSSERRSLAFFESRTSQEWSGWEDSHFWNVLALQLSQESHAVARSLIAVSALHERMEAMGSLERARLQELCCEQSSKATNALLARDSMPYFEALVSCLIMICFRGLQHSQASFLLLRSGMRLLAECDDHGRVSREERAMVDGQLRPLFNRLLSKPCGMGDIFKAFTLSVERHRAKSIAAIEKPLMPSVFRSISEARDCLSRILSWAHDNIACRLWSEQSMEIFLASFHQLKDAWETSLAQSSFSKTAKSLRSQRLLQAACLVGLIITANAHCPEETACDRFQPEFEQIISLMEGVKLSGHSFGIDAGLMDIVAFVGTKCRDPHIRRRALKLLKSEARIEGDRVASNPATILEALIALEERGLEVETCHDIPEANRRRLVCGQQHVAQARIDLFYASADGSKRERCCVSLAGVGSGKGRKNLDSGADVPDAIFGAGYAAYLENRPTRSYFRLELDRFYFPIPKV